MTAGRTRGSAANIVLSTMREVASDRNSTLVFPLPIELLRLVDTLRDNRGNGRESQRTSISAAPDQPYSRPTTGT